MTAIEHDLGKNPPIVCCGMLRPEMTHLVETGFLNPRRILYTAPGLHALPGTLEQHLTRRLEQARQVAPDGHALVVYGRKCYVNPDDPARRVDTILQSAEPAAVRVQGEYGYDMIAGYDERQRLSGGRQDKVLWFTAGWLKHWKLVYQEYFHWDRADANANFPGFYDRIVVLDSLNLEEEYTTHRAEEILELFDWTGLEVVFEPVTLDRFKGLLTDALGADAPSLTRVHCPSPKT